ncbi:hypothetical protein [Congregibacter sp.]|uniref:hypothetical protein n=1 Tax=Congregibacter sp. TaxID=2744308 RepID=UPI003F6AC5E6
MTAKRWKFPAMNKSLWVGLLALCLSGVVSAQNLFLTLANQPPTSGIVTTRDNSNLTLTVMSGSRVSFARASGRDYQLQASGGFFWTQVQEQPRGTKVYGTQSVAAESLFLLVEPR